MGRVENNKLSMRWADSPVLISLMTGQREFNHRGQVPAGLQHHISVEFPLTRVQQGPFLQGEVHSHIFKDH